MDYNAVSKNEESISLQFNIREFPACKRGRRDSYYFAITNEIIDSGRDHQWMLKPLDKRVVGEHTSTQS